MQPSIYRIRATYAQELTLQQVADKIASAFTKTSNGCWQWFRSLDKNGYGMIGLWGRNGTNPRAGQYPAHRVVYELIHGTIPSDKQIDHLCGNIRCVNPSHLEVVTKDENNIRGNSPSAIHARKTHCPKGHPYSGHNLYVELKPNGKSTRRCRICRSIQKRDYYQKRKLIQASARKEA